MMQYLIYDQIIQVKYGIYLNHKDHFLKIEKLKKKYNQNLKFTFFHFAKRFYLFLKLFTKCMHSHTKR